MKPEIADFSQARVLIVGDVMLDRYWSGGTSRISPEAPVPVVRVGQIEERAGGAANVALNIASLGGQAPLIGLVGDDEAAGSLSTCIEASKVENHLVRVPNFPTITKLRVMSRHQQLIRLDFEEDFSKADHDPMVHEFMQNLASADVVILSDYAKGALAEVRKMILLAKEAGVPVLVDPKGTDFTKYRGASLLTPNFSEFQAVVGECESEEEIITKGLELVEHFELDALLVTRGENGMTLIQKGEQAFHLPAMAREVYDVTGAGDTVIATLATALAVGQSYRQAVALANTAAGIVVGKLGTATISVPELTAAIYFAPESEMGVVNEAQLKTVVEQAKARGETIVMTNGCFDILHAGHVAYLNAAKKLGSRLIVAVNSDASVRGLKGAGRPVNPVERRMEVLAGLGAVDWVVPFEEETPERLICNILPNILVKGGDYKVEDIAGGKCVIANGGEVKVLAFLEGCSTTDIIESIMKKEQ
tara:strand:+ start:3646 stop:5076 length:1431 start_codon:yes stop_codon:yes gene_type:complete